MISSPVPVLTDISSFVIAIPSPAVYVVSVIVQLSTPLSLISSPVPTLIPPKVDGVAVTILIIGIILLAAILEL